MQQVKVYWMHSHFLYWMGGTKYIYEVIKRLKNTFDITVVVDNASQEAIKQYKETKVEIISPKTITSTSLLYWLFLPVHIIKMRNFLKTKIKQKKSMKTVIVSSMFPANVVASLLPYSHIQYCFEPFAFFFDKEFVKNFPLVKRLLISLAKLLWSKLDIWATKRADKLITLNNTTAKYINEVYSRNSNISFAGIDTKHFTPFVENKLKKKYQNKLVIVHSTDYTPVKGTDRMIKIFSEVKKVISSAHLLITSTIRNEPEKTRLEKLAVGLGVAKSIEFLGFVNYKILPQIYSLSKVLVQCSYSERSGTTSMALPVKEAMACGTLAIRFPIKNEDVEDGKTGFLVDPRNTREMVDKIQMILKMDKKRYNIASGHARKYIVNRYTWEATANKIKNVINSVF